MLFDTTRRGLTLCPVGLTGPQVEDEQVEVDDGEVSLVG